MRRKVYSSKEIVPPERTIDITFIVDRSEEGKIAAAKFAEPYTSNKNKLTRGEYGVYKVYITSIESAILAHGFKVLDSHQSRVSYSYYIVFEVPSNDGDAETWKIRFRVSDHYQDSNESGVDSVKRHVFLWIMFGRKQLTDSFSYTVNYVNSLLDDLENGDMDSVLDKYSTYLSDYDWESEGL